MQKLFSIKVDEILAYQKELTAYTKSFEADVKKLLKLNTFTLSEGWYTSYVDVLQAAGKMTGKQEAALEKLFTAAAKEMLNLKALIEITDRQIVNMVHEQMEAEARESAELLSQSIAEVQQKRAGVFKAKVESEKIASNSNSISQQ